jgi:cobalamin biosynthesis protein CobT
MDVVQFHIALSIYNEFLADGVSGFEWWRDCSGSVHFAAVHDGKVVEASVYMDEAAYDLFVEHVDDEDDEDEEDEEDAEEEDAEEEEAEEESESDDDYEPDEDAGPPKRQRRD